MLTNPSYIDSTTSIQHEQAQLLRFTNEGKNFDVHVSITVLEIQVWTKLCKGKGQTNRFCWLVMDSWFN